MFTKLQNNCKFKF